MDEQTASDDGCKDATANIGRLRCNSSGQYRWE